jgi:hypothetical protein
MAANDLGRRAPIARADTSYEILVRVSHGLAANSAPQRIL